MQTKHQFHIQEKTIASVIALSVFALAILFAVFVLPSVPKLMQTSYQKGVPMAEFQGIKSVDTFHK